MRDNVARLRRVVAPHRSLCCREGVAAVRRRRLDPLNPLTPLRRLRSAWRVGRLRAGVVAPPVGRSTAQPVDRGFDRADYLAAVARAGTLKRSTSPSCSMRA